MRSTSIFLALLLAIASSVAMAQEQAFTNRATDLMDKGAPDGRKVASLPENTSVTVVQRAGGWTRIEAGGQTGWVRAFHLRFPTQVQSSGSSGNVLSGIGGALFGKSQPKTTVATTGIRGLSQEDFRNAAPDVAALQRIQSYRADRASAERFAREARLVSVSINYLMDEASAPRRRR